MLVVLWWVYHGVLFAGIMSDKLGRKMTMIISAVFFYLSSRVCFLYGLCPISDFSHYRRSWNRCRFHISSLIYIRIGQLMGVNAILYYGPFIFEKAALSESDSLFYQIFVGAVNTLISILALIIGNIGRKQLVYYGASEMIVSLVSISIYFLAGESWNSFLLLFFLFYVFSSAISICAVIFVLLSEMYPTRVCGFAMSAAVFSLWIGIYLIGQLTPWILQNLSSVGTFFLFVFMCVLYILIIWKLVPETIGKSLEEIEQYWNCSENGNR